MSDEPGPVAVPSPAAALVRLARMKAGLSQGELAVRAGVPRSMISAYERDRRQPTLATLLRVLRAAGLELRMHLEPYVWADDAEREDAEHGASAAHRAQWARWHAAAGDGSA
ncbi:MAG: helix-turn-helix transcriptional regulator [Acidimicrobiales bacterium]